MRITDNLQENFPFISVLTHADKEYVGIIINQDNNVTSFYDYEKLKTQTARDEFIELGEAWWWESNRMIPINIFLSSEIYKQFPNICHLRLMRRPPSFLLAQKMA